MVTEDFSKSRRNRDAKPRQPSINMSNKGGIELVVVEPRVEELMEKILSRVDGRPSERRLSQIITRTCPKS